MRLLSSSVQRLAWGALVSLVLLGLLGLPGLVRQHRILAQQALGLARQLQDTITLQLTARTWTLQRLARQWNYEGRPSQQTWSHDVAVYLHDQAGYELLAWVEATGQLRWHVKQAHATLPAFAEALLQQLRARGTVTIVAPFGPHQQHLLLATPVQAQGVFDGWLLGVIYLPAMLPGWLPTSLPLDYDTTIMVNNAIVYRAPSAHAAPHLLLTRLPSFEIAGSTWEVEILPPPVTRSLLDVSATDIFPGLGACLALGVAWTLRKKRQSRRGAAQKAADESAVAPARSSLLTHPPLSMAQPELALYCIDHQGLLTYISPQAALMLGWHPEEVLHKPQHVFLHHTLPDGRVYPRDACPIDIALRDGTPCQVTHDLFWRRNGTRFPATYTCTPVRDTQQHVIGVMVVFQRLQETKPAEAENATATACDATS